MKLFGLEFGLTKTEPITIRKDEVEGSRPIEIKKIKQVNSQILSYRSSVTQRGSFEPSEWNLGEIGRVEDVESYVRQSFRKKCGLMFKEGWELVSPNHKTIRYLQERFKQIEAAAGIPIKLLLRETAMDLIKYSNAYWYKVRSLKQSGGKRRELPSGRIVNPVAGYFKIPPEMVEIKRNKNGKVLKYRQRTPEGRIQEYEPISVIHFYFDKKSGFATGTPVLVPVMDDIRALRRIEENIELLVYQHLFPLFHYKVGTETAPAEIYPDGTNEVDIVRQEVQFMPSEGSIVTPERHEITALGAEGRAIRAEGYLTHFKKRVFSGLGFSAVDFGEGETANRATADNMSRALVDDVKAMQREFETFIDEFLIKELLLESTFSFDIFSKENIAHLKFHEVDLDAKIKVENHEMTLYQGFMATEDEARKAMGREPITDEERDNTFWEIVKKPQAIIQSLDEAFLQEEAVGSTGIDSEGAEQSKANKRRVAEEEKLTKAKGKPTTKPTGAENKAKAKNQPSNQHGTNQGPTKRKSSLIVDNVINKYYQILKSNTIEAVKSKQYDKLWLKSHAFTVAAEVEEKFIRELKTKLRKGICDSDIMPYMIDLDFAFNIVRDRAHTYIIRIIDRLIELAEFRLHDKINKLKSEEIIAKLIAIFDALEFRTDLVYNSELHKAYVLGLAIGLKAAGFTQAQLNVKETACEECKNNQDLTFNLEYIIIDELPGLHPNCHCTIKPIHNNPEDSTQDLTAKERRCVLRVIKQLRSKFPKRSKEAIEVSAIKICRKSINETDQEIENEKEESVDGMVEKFTEEDFNDKRTVRLYDMVNIQLKVDDEKTNFIKDNIFTQNRGHSLMARIAATHAGLITRNNGFYMPDKMLLGAESMIKPYPKPVLLHHDSYKDPIGRIIATEYINTSGSLIKSDSRFADFVNPKKSFIHKINLIDGLLDDDILNNPDYQGLGYISAIINITDSTAIEKIADERYLTVSIGASTDKAICSICKADWAGEDGPCEHRPGKMYDGKKAFIIAGNLMYEELSFVNSPADPFARVIEVYNSTGDVEQFKLETEDDDVITDEKAELYIITDDNIATTLTDNSVKEGVRSLFADIAKQKKEDIIEHPELAEADKKKSSSPTGTKKNKNNPIEEVIVSEKNKKQTKVDGVSDNDEKVVDQEGKEIKETSATDSQEVPEDKVKDSEQEETEEETKAKEEKTEVEDKEKEVEDKVKEEVSEPEPSETETTDDAVDNSDTKVLESITLDDVKDSDKLTVKIKEAYEFMTDKQVAEAVKETQSEALKDNFLEEIVMIMRRITGTIIDRDFNADEFYAEMEKELDEIGSDAKLSTAQRKKLPSSAFCGPNRSFPVPDCAHVIAARRLIGRAKISSSTKTKILACVSRKAKALGCGTVKKDEAKPKVKEEAREQEVKKQELTCETFNALKEEEFKTVLEVVKAEAEKRHIQLIESKEENMVSEEVTKELEVIKETKIELDSQLKALRGELKDVYQDCADLEDAKAGLIESLHKERAQRLCEFKVLTGDINDQGELEKHLEEDITKSSEILLENLTNIFDKVNLYEVAEKVNDGIDHKPEGEVENPILSNTEDDSSEEETSSKIRTIYEKKVVEEGHKAANRYLESLRKARLLPSNFKL